MNSTASETAKRVRQIRADALLGKKKHYNAADRKQCYQAWLGTGVIGINVLLGSALLILIKESIPEYVKWIGAALALLAALFSTLQTYFGFSKAVQGHRAIAGRYLEVVKLCSNLLAANADGSMSGEQIAKKLDSLTIMMNKIDADAHAYPTSDTDFQKARFGIAEGEEEYTDRDLSAGD